MADGSWEGCDKPARRGALCCVRCVVWRVETPETPALKLSLRTASSRHGSRRMQDAGCRMLDDVDSGWPSSLRSGLSARLPRLVRRARVGAHHSSLARAYLRPATRRVTAGASCLPSRRALRTSASMRGTSSETLIMVMVMFMYMPTCGGRNAGAASAGAGRRRMKDRPNTRTRAWIERPPTRSTQAGGHPGPGSSVGGCRGVRLAAVPVVAAAGAAAAAGQDATAMAAAAPTAARTASAKALGSGVLCSSSIGSWLAAHGPGSLAAAHRRRRRR